MDAFEQLLATLDGSIASLDTMIQNADASDKKDDVKNEDKKDEQIANLTAKIANLEARLKNEGKEDDETIKNLASRIVNLLKNTDKDDDSVKNKGVKNKGVKNTDDEDDKVQNSEEKDDERVVNLAKKIVNLLRNACSDKKDEVQNSDDKEPVKNKGVKNKGVRNDDEEDDDDDEDKSIENLFSRISNIEARLKNSGNGDDDSVKNKGVKNKGVRNTDDGEEKDKVQNSDDDEKSVKNKAVTNALSEILGDLVTARQKTVHELMNVIVTNSGGVYTKEELTGKSMEELQKLSHLVAKVNMPVVNASQSNIQMDTTVMNEDVALDIPSTFPAQQ